MSAARVLVSPGLNVPRSAQQSADHLLGFDAETFRARFNRKPFIVGHGLVNHPLFTLPQLINLSKRLPAGHVKYNAGAIPVDTALYKGPQTGLSIEETIRRIEECRSWMVLKWVQEDRDYRAVLNRCLDEVQALSEPLDPGMCKREAFIFVTSPSSTTPYHLDPEYSFLLQIKGRKSVYVMDGSTLTEKELERYYSAGIDPVFTEACREKAMRFDLEPGLGLHFPVTVPHWVETHDEYSISFSITFRTASSERRSVVYEVNDSLRKLGFNPTPYGRSALRDSVKFHAFRATRRARKALGLATRRNVQKH
ncbi:MAG TPA: cupin domain-containing protein [Blastocatellia bacterium]|nr:cupin domain-containing protein [Blastocatellia bacterium]